MARTLYVGVISGTSGGCSDRVLALMKAKIWLCFNVFTMQY